ncbi:integrin alpha-4-like isoform X2 [Maniola jurtina]|uniref:integrin alpha-4-like isoform X2 n=1 Tax=Maniola jurtina TaxID=191418 RepID=UPI001E68A23B|nr:integrin alpha-4-like isoform X2 [Maniola jurtina]
MTGNLLFWFILVVKAKAVTFLHDPSYVEIMPPEKATDFGSTLAYHTKMQSLVVGAPFSDLNGKVYQCPINGDVLKNKKIVCSQLPINITKEVPNYSRSKSPDQHFGLGASISVTPEYIFTCAPLLTLDIPTSGGNMFGACGTCFVSNGTTTNRYVGIVEQYEQDMNTKHTTKIDINHFYGGVGWTTLSDVANKLIILAKPMPVSTLNFVDMDQPLMAVKEVDAVHENVAANYKYIGGALAYGTFFKGYPKLYAFSADRDMRFGFIAFLSYNDQVKKMDLLKFGTRRPKVVLIKDDKVGSMFGSTLHSANLCNSNYTDLLVGAPAQVNVEGGYESGAVHIYTGGVPLDTEFPRFKRLCIYSNKDASRFGSSITTTDLDEDGYPEIFISAPYEDGGKGSVYIISGYEVNQLFSKIKTLDIQSVPISDLVHTQIIQNPGLQTLGFSLQALPVPPFDESGAYFLAIGSPKSSKVALYRSIPIIKVDIKARLKDVERVREQDKNFTVSVIVDITYPSNLKVITGKIIITTRIEGDAGWIEKDNYYEIMLSKKPTHNVTDVVVLLGNYKKGLYKFNATVQSATENLKRKDFDSSLVDISPLSKTTVEFSIMRECQGEDCVPNLSLTFQWLGSNKTHYTLGSTASETMSLVVQNDGGATFGSCARIKVTGAKVELLECNTEEGWYKCDLTDIERYTTRSIPIHLDMSKPTNKESSLMIEVMLYNVCTKPNMENYTKTIPYEFNTDGIYFNSTNFNQIITDVEIEDVEAGPYYIDINELFTVTNKGIMAWSSLPLEIYLQEESFIADYLIQIDVGDCTKDEVQLKYNCVVDLEPDTTVKVQGTVTLVKDKIREILIKDKLKVVSHFKLHMKPTVRTLDKMYITKILYQKTTSLKNNIYMVIAIAVSLGVFVMAIIIIALFKGGFFKRKEKQKLVELKHEIRKQSIRRPAIDDLPQCVIGPESEDQDQDNGSTGTSSSEKLLLLLSAKP